MTTGVLVMAYGGPDSLDDVAPYLQDVRGGRATPPAIVEEVRARYARIGGRSPIRERTAAQTIALDALLNDNGTRYTVAMGMRHWHPYIRDAVASLRSRGVDRLVGLVMAPQYSRLSIGAYYRALEASADGMDIRPIEHWHLLPGYIATIAARVREAWAWFPETDRARVPVLYTAHSLPERILEWDDPYPAQLRETVEAVVALIGPHEHRIAFQSAAMTPEPWLGPDAGDVLEEVAAAGAAGVVIAPIGFVCEHVEILYDVDVELRNRAAALGLRHERIRMIDDAPATMQGLADLIRAHAREAGWT